MNTTVFTCEKCGKILVGEYHIEKKRIGLEVKTFLLCKSCKIKQIKRRLLKDAIVDQPDPAYIYTQFFVR
ncbi:hypothetical protein [Candidatus Harpocratesius sp.]